MSDFSYDTMIGGLRLFFGRDQQGPRKKQRVEEVNDGISEADWDEFEQELRTFDIQHVQGKGRFAFAFVEGPLVKALRSGDWYALIISIRFHISL